MRGFPEFRKKYAWCRFSMNFLHKNCSIENVQFVYVYNFARFKQFTGILKFTFIKDDTKSMLLLTIYFFQVCSAGAALRDTAIVYVTVNIRVVR